jgi:RNA polymerase primary sigma factor
MGALVTMQRAGPDDVLGPSLAAAMRHPGLSVERERGIVVRAQAGDVAAGGTLAMAYTRLVVRVAHGFAGRGVTLADLVQEGMVGLTDAISGFDLARGCRFSTYAVYRIRREMLAAIAASDVIRVPADARRQLAAVRASEGRRGRGEPSNGSLLAADAGVSAARVEQLRGRAEVIASLDEPVGEDVATLADVIPDVSAQSPDEAVLDRGLQRDLWATLRKLDRRTRAVIVMRYGLAGDAQWEHARIGARLGISPERSRQLEQHGLRRLRILLAGPVSVSQSTTGSESRERTRRPSPEPGGDANPRSRRVGVRAEPR